MDDEILRKNNQNTAAWIFVLALAITCCAVLFYIFATSLSAINNNLTMANARLTAMENNETQLLYEIQSLHHALTTANAPAPAALPTSTPAPAPSTEPGAAPTAATPPTTPPASPSAGTAAPLTPPPAAKTTVPEVPATTH
jgi:hypothetical protein